MAKAARFLIKRFPTCGYNGGMWVSWDGRPEGAIWVTHSRDVAYGAEYGPTGETWRHTGYQGADASCRWDRVIRLAADLWPQ